MQTATQYQRHTEKTIKLTLIENSYFATSETFIDAFGTDTLNTPFSGDTPIAAIFQKLNELIA